jgi:hypothetical protein
MIIGTEVNTLLLLPNTLNLEAVNPGHSNLFCTRLRCELLHILTMVNNERI